MQWHAHSQKRVDILLSAAGQHGGQPEIKLGVSLSKLLAEVGHSYVPSARTVMGISAFVIENKRRNSQLHLPSAHPRSQRRRAANIQHQSV